MPQNTIQLMKKMIIFRLLVSVVFFVPFALVTQAQVTIGEDGVPHTGAVLDLRSGDSKGLLLPRVSLNNAGVFQLDVNAGYTAANAAGMMVYNTNPSTTGGSGVGIYVWSGTAWAKADDATSYTAGTGINISGGVISSTVVDTNTDNQTLSWANASRTLSISGPAGSSVVIPDNNTTYTAGTGINITAGVISSTVVDTNTDNQTLSWTDATRTLSISGPAGSSVIIPAGGGGSYTAGAGLTLSGTTFSHANHTGDVTGNTVLTIADDAVTSAKIANGTIVNADIADNTITAAKLTGGTAGQILTATGTGAPTWQTPAASGGVQGGVKEVSTSSYTVTANDYLIVTTGTACSISFPILTAADTGKTVIVFNKNSDSSANVILGGIAGNPANNNLRGLTLIWSGSTWVVTSQQ